MSEPQQPDAVEARFLGELRHHLVGLRAKIVSDFGEENFAAELGNLQRDAVYAQFAFDTPEYVLVRLMGRVSISVGRRLGEIYDKIPRFVAAARFGLPPEQVAPKIGGLILDIGIQFNLLQPEEVERVKEVVVRHLGERAGAQGVGIEIRYNFNPNDSARLRKDVTMAENLIVNGLQPIYLIFSAISPREEAIARLRRAGWTFCIGNAASDFAKDLLGLDLATILERSEVQQEIRQEVNAIMAALVDSFAFQSVLSRYNERSSQPFQA